MSTGPKKIELIVLCRTPLVSVPFTNCLTMLKLYMHRTIGGRCSKSLNYVYFHCFPKIGLILLILKHNKHGLFSYFCRVFSCGYLYISKTNNAAFAFT